MCVTKKRLAGWGGILKILKKVESRKINPKEAKRKKFNDEDESSKRQHATSS
jgi:hypothetical protein